VTVEPNAPDPVVLWVRCADASTVKVGVGQLRRRLTEDPRGTLRVLQSAADWVARRRHAPDVGEASGWQHGAVSVPDLPDLVVGLGKGKGQGKGQGKGPTVAALQGELKEKEKKIQKLQRQLAEAREEVRVAREKEADRLKGVLHVRAAAAWAKARKEKKLLHNPARADSPEPARPEGEGEGEGEGPGQEGPGQEGPGQEGPGQEGPGQEGPLDERQSASTEVDKAGNLGGGGAPPPPPPPPPPGWGGPAAPPCTPPPYC
jgi:hypothetical protein